MPELPEVEYAIQQLRKAVAGRRIVDVRRHHAAVRRTLSAADIRRLRGVRIAGVTRRGKHQLLELEGGGVLHVHFRMSGDWEVGDAAGSLPKHARLTLDLDDGRRVALVDPRALATVRRHASAEAALPELGLEATDPMLDGAALGQALRGRRMAIKVALLDQRVVAGVGNIYAAEALWHARIDPRVPAGSLRRARLDRLVDAIKHVMGEALASAGRYRDGAVDRFAVYDREGQPCLRCGTRIRRIVQGGRSTYYCPKCQRV
jgi:formamidopyrimidine-DNA glycosylase